MKSMKKLGEMYNLYMARMHVRSSIPYAERQLYRDTGYFRTTQRLDPSQANDIHVGRDAMKSFRILLDLRLSENGLSKKISELEGAQ